MGERQAVADAGSRTALLVSTCLLAAGMALAASRQAQAQSGPASCEPAVARLVALQGDVEVQRADSEAWVRVTRLDTTLCAGDRLRTGALSRAGLHVQPETVVRVDQNTVITLNHSADEIAVEFFVAELAAKAANARSCGAGYFITRFPKKFEVRTPHMNAAVEGTEFAVETSCDATRLAVLEGRVSSESAATGDRKVVEAGQSLSSGVSGAGAITTVVRPADAVQWALRFPPISDQSLAAGSVGGPACAAPATGDRSECLAARAEALLRSGSVDEALDAIDAALAADNSSSDGYALRSIVLVAKNDHSAALESAGRAIDVGAGNFRAWLALSYAQQAVFDLEASLASAKRSQALMPKSSLASARVAELLLSLGDSRGAEQTARMAIASNPAEGHAHSILGFVHLARIDTRAARADFEAAIGNDSFDSLPRLGLGLTLIREGQLVAGREQIEIAVALDPSNSLLRSYVGKAYYEENSRARDELSSTQLKNATVLDPLDPTPSLYDAIRLQTGNQPVAALREIRNSIALNGNRAVFRSRLKLDEDLAVRGASLGRIYSDLGFERLALSSGWAAVNRDPGDFSGHRLLADTYSSQQRHEIARVSELYVSQLLQPLNLTPIPAQLGEANLFILDTAGPTDVSFNEFNPVFARNRWALHLSATVGGNSTWGNDATVAAIADRWSLSLGQFHFETDGFRANNDLEQDIHSAFAQFRQSERTSVMAEVRSTNREQGDLRLLFDPGNFDPQLRSEEDSDSVRLGARHDFTPNSQMLASVVYQDAEFAALVPDIVDVSGNVDSLIGELQYLLSSEHWRFIGGWRQTRRDLTESLTTFIPLPEVSVQRFRSDSTSVYGYLNWTVNDSASLVTGISGDFLEGRTIDVEQANPKFGFVWSPTDKIRVRAAATRSIQPDSYSRQDVPPRLEPTQTAGFNHVYSGVQGEREWRYGGAVEVSATERVFFGAEISKRDIETPFVSPGGDEEILTVDSKEYSGVAYGYWTPHSSVALGATYRYDDQQDPSAFYGFTELRTHRLPLTMKYFHGRALGVDLAVTYIDQKGDFLEFLPDPPFVREFRDGDRFWMLDAGLSYRLPRRMGILRIDVKNLLDEDMRFQDIDPENPQIYPERFMSLRVTVAIQ